MDAKVPWSVRAQPLSDDAFAPYGDIIEPRRSGNQFDRSHTNDPAKTEPHVKLVLTNGEPVLRIMHQKHRGLVFSGMARHLRVSQCLGSLQGKEWFMAFAAPTPGKSAPDPAAITAFRIPGDRIVKLHVGTWHAGPHFTHDECLFLNLENEDTNTRDFEDVALPQPCTIEP